MKTLNDAILSLKPNARFQMKDNDFESIDWLDTPEIDKCTLAEAEAKLVELQAQEEAEEQAKIDAQVSGNQKLLDLGLTQAEATALTGYTPPVAE